MKVQYIGDQYPILFKVGEVYPVISIEEGLLRVYSPVVEEEGLFSPVAFKVVEAEPPAPVLEMREV